MAGILASCEDWAKTTFHEVVKNNNETGLVTTLAIDCFVFLVCLLVHKVEVRRTTDRAPRLDQKFGRLGTFLKKALDTEREPSQHHLLTTPLVGEATPSDRRSQQHLQSTRWVRGATSAVSGYLALLDSGFWLFGLLWIISWTACAFQWGPAPMFGVAAIRSMEQETFSGEAACRRGFPVGAEPLQCVSMSQFLIHGNHSTLAPWFPHTTYMECKDLAVWCSARSLAYSPTQHRCWLFNSTSLGDSDTHEDYEFCVGSISQRAGFVELGLAFAYGLITIAVALSFLYRVTLRESWSGLCMHERCTIWLSELPTRDSIDGEVFYLEEEEFDRVEQDINDAITKQINEQISETRADASQYLSEVKVLDVHVARRPARGRSNSNKAALSGQAFVVLSRHMYAESLLLRRGPLWGMRCLDQLPSYVHWRDHTLFKFGKAPWSAVTVRCQRAPPTSDINWANLYTDRKWLSRIGIFLTVLIVLVFFAPVLVASSLHEIVDNMAHDGNTDRFMTTAMLDKISLAVDQVPSYLMLLMNSLIMPVIITCLCSCGLPDLKSQQEQEEFSANFSFLMLVSLVIPAFGLVPAGKSIMEQAVALAGSVEKTSDLRTLMGLPLEAPAKLLAKYMMNAALVTPALQLIHLSPSLGNWLTRCCTRCCRRPSKEANSIAQPFAWGYWGAWAMSLLSFALLLSIVMPVILPLATIAFFLTRYAHRSNFNRGVYDVPFNMSQAFMLRIGVCIIKIVALFWLVMAVFFFVQRPIAEGGVRMVIPVDLRDLNLERHHVKSCLISLAVAVVLGLGGWIAHGESFERFWFARCRSAGPIKLWAGLLSCGACAAFIVAFLQRPEIFVFEERLVPYHQLFSAALGCAALLCILFAHLVNSFGRRLLRGTGMKRMQLERLADGTHYASKEVLAEEEVDADVPFPDVVCRGDWYRPPGLVVESSAPQTNGHGKEALDQLTSSRPVAETKPLPNAAPAAAPTAAQAAAQQPPAAQTAGFSNGGFAKGGPTAPPPVATQLLRSGGPQAAAAHVGGTSAATYTLSSGFPYAGLAGGLSASQSAAVRRPLLAGSSAGPHADGAARLSAGLPQRRGTGDMSARGRQQVPPTWKPRSQA
eukprot:TRINITY_DN64503_c0_g1_i1.p1 TRINITY_DN64503_c0_g1~~TRINITY_DN64503_c0_g1_i1.p1  ORF type:complete len:1107 (-),score=177.87 TRINITY_DN64503_c0_g1_i1:60-3380(-)